MSGPHFRASERPEPLLVRAPVGHALVVATVGLGTSAALLWVVSTGFFTDAGSSSRGGVGVIASFVWIAYAAPTGLWVLLRALLRLPLLRVDEHGIRTTWTWDATGLTPWGDVRRIRLRHSCISVEVEGPVAVYRRTPALRHRTLRRHEREHGSPVTIGLAPLRPRVPETVTLLHHWRNHVAWARDRHERLG